MAEVINKYGLLAVPVVDGGGRHVGHYHGRRRILDIFMPEPSKLDTLFLVCRAQTGRKTCIMIRLKEMRTRAGLFLAVMGPGIVTAFADNDAGGIATYAAAGSKYGYGLLFTLFVATICLAIAQEISARTGAVTGRGLSDLIREIFGVKWTLFAMIVLLIANIGTTASEFSGIATSFEIFGVSRYVAVPITAFFIWWMVLKGSYGRVEKLFLLLCATFISYIISGVIVNPPWEEVLSASVTPSFAGDAEFLMMADRASSVRRSHPGDSSMSSPRSWTKASRRKIIVIPSGMS